MCERCMYISRPMRLKNMHGMDDYDSHTVHIVHTMRERMHHSIHSVRVRSYRRTRTLCRRFIKRFRSTKCVWFVYTKHIQVNIVHVWDTTHSSGGVHLILEAIRSVSIVRRKTLDLDTRAAAAATADILCILVKWQHINCREFINLIFVAIFFGVSNFACLRCSLEYNCVSIVRTNSVSGEENFLHISFQVIKWMHEFFEKRFAYYLSTYFSRGIHISQERALFISWRICFVFFGRKKKL